MKYLLSEEEYNELKKAESEEVLKLKSKFIGVRNHLMLMDKKICWHNKQDLRIALPQGFSLVAHCEECPVFSFARQTLPRERLSDPHPVFKFIKADNTNGAELLHTICNLPKMTKERNVYPYLMWSEE